MTRAKTKASHPKDLQASLKKEAAQASPPKISSKESPYDHPQDFIWSEGDKHTASIAVRKPSGWAEDPAFDEGKYFEAYRSAMIADSQWCGE
jgi:hypothetical protein